MEERKDILDMISSLEFALKYAGLIGQVPYLHPWLAGNHIVMKIMERILHLQIQLEPLWRYDFAQSPGFGTNTLAKAVVFSSPKSVSMLYDRNEKEKETSDFLTFLRLEEKKNKDTMPHGDLINHLSNNL